MDVDGLLEVIDSHKTKVGTENELAYALTIWGTILVVLSALASSD
jgi:hypothetical protein